MSRVREVAPSYRATSRPGVCRLGTALRDAAGVAAALRDIAGASVEHFVCFDLDARHRVISRRVMAIGSVCGVEVHPREVFRGAIVASAVAIIIAHNHPSGDTAPSRQDLELTQRLREAGKMLGIEILDHVIVGGDGWTSMAADYWAPLPGEVRL